MNACMHAHMYYKLCVCVCVTRKCVLVPRGRRRGREIFVCCPH